MNYSENVEQNNNQKKKKKSAFELCGPSEAECGGEGGGVVLDLQKTVLILLRRTDRCYQRAFLLATRPAE